MADSIIEQLKGTMQDKDKDELLNSNLKYIQENIAISQYLNSEFQRMDMTNTRGMLNTLILQEKELDREEISSEKKMIQQLMDSD